MKKFILSAGCFLLFVFAPSAFAAEGRSLIDYGKLLDSATLFSSEELVASAESYEPRDSVASLEESVIAQAITRRDSLRVSRSEFIQQAVDVLYGKLSETYTAPYENIPAEARNAIGVARRVGAITEWGRDAKWDTSATRGEALRIIFNLAQVKANSGMETRFKDIRSKAQSQIVKQALNWRLLEPLTPRTFGWSRVITMDEFKVLLENLSARISSPLTVPEVKERPKPDRSRFTVPRQTRTRTGRTTRGSRTPRKVTVKIEMGKVDRGSSMRTNKRDLPQNDLLETVWGLIKGKFLYQDKIDEEEIAYSLAEQLLKELEDPYTTFLRPRTNRRFQEQIEGSDRSFSGIGAHVRTHAEGGVEVVTPLPGSPAMQAGVRSGDRIVEVDGVSVIDMSLNDAVDMIRGPKGKPVRLTIEREDVGGKMVITVTRNEIIVKDLFVTEQDGVSIIRLTSFSRGAMNEFNGVVKEVMASNPLGIVLDLRNNPGGLLDAAILVSSHFLQEGDLIVKVERRDSKQEHRAVGGERTVPSTLPVAVLVNKGSASASEIVAGALKDHGRAEVIGQTTFGKGTVQEAMEFAARPGQTPPAAKLTVAEWLTPDGHKIEGKGVSPTIEVPDSQVGGRDEALLRAISVIKAKAR